MKINILLITLVTVFEFACSYPKYLAHQDKIDINQYGSEVIITRTRTPVLYAELIAADSNQLIVRTYPRYKHPQTIIQIPMSTVKNLTLRYAKPLNYGWTIPLFTIQTIIMHGLLFVLTAPLNLFITLFINGTGDYAYTYKLKHLRIADLKMFSRFPQGIPPNIPLDSIK